MSNFKYIPFDAALPMLRLGDVALFRGRSIVSAFIASVTTSPYTHVGVIDPRDGLAGADLLEFREFCGGRMVDLENEVKRNSGRIDIYRFPPSIHKYRFDDGELTCDEIEFDGARVVTIMRRLTGLPYDYRRIFQMLAWKIPVLRSFLVRYKKSYGCDKIDKLKLRRFVCSTSVDYSFERAGFSLVPNKNTNYIDPSDIARSANLNYLFTLQK